MVAFESMSLVEPEDVTGIDEPATTKRGRSRWRGLCCKAAGCLGILLVIGLGVMLVMFGPTAKMYLAKVRRPYARLYAPTPAPASAVLPLFDQDTKFDVALTVWMRLPCDPVAKDCQRGGWSTSHNENRRYQLDSAGRVVSVKHQDFTTIPERQLFSKVVMEGYSLHSEERTVTLDIDIPVHDLKPPDRNDGYGPSDGYDIRAVVSFNPQPPSLLDHVDHWEASTPKGMIVPPALGDELTSTGAWGEPNSTKRQVLEALSIHVPLVHNVWKPRGRMESSLDDMVHVYMMNESHPMNRQDWLASFKETSEDRRWCGQYFGNDNGSFHRCDQYDSKSSMLLYGEKGHFKAKYSLDGGTGNEDDTQLAYNPATGLIRAGRGMLTGPRLNATAEPEILHAKLTLIMSVFSPARNMAQQFIGETVGDPSRFAGHNPDNWERDRRSAHDIWAITNGLIGSPIEGVHTWRRIVFVGLHKLFAMAAIILSAVYWYTRRTAAGISHAAIWMRVLVVLPRTIHFLLTGVFKHTYSFNFFGFVSLIIIIVVLASPEIYQLRLIAPIDLRGSGWGLDPTGTWGKVQHTVNDPCHSINIDATIKMNILAPMRRWTKRERDTMRLESARQALVMMAPTFIASVIFFYICRGYIIPPPLPPSHDYTTQDFLAKFTKAIGWAGFATASVLQVLMNHRAGTFAGTYAVVAFIQVAIEAGNLLYHTQLVMGKYYVSNGWSIFEASRALFSLVVAYQAATLPKVLQVVPQDQEAE